MTGALRIALPRGASRSGDVRDVLPDCGLSARRCCRCRTMRPGVRSGHEDVRTRRAKDGGTLPVKADHILRLSRGETRPASSDRKERAHRLPALAGHWRLRRRRRAPRGKGMPLSVFPVCSASLEKNHKKGPHAWRGAPDIRVCAVRLMFLLQRWHRLAFPPEISAAFRHSRRTGRPSGRPSGRPACRRPSSGW